jgi:aconitate hydratase 2/2-methylisocitrate dehydratase
MISKLPTVEEYMDAVEHLEPMADDIYRYLNFNKMEDYQSIADTVLPVALSS